MSSYFCFQFSPKIFNCIEMWWLRWSFNNLWAVVIRNVKNVLGHCYGKIPSFSTLAFRCSWWKFTKHVCLCCLRQNEDFPLLMLPCIPTPSHCHRHVWLLHKEFFSKVFTQVLSAHNYVHLNQILYTCFHQQIKLFSRILNPSVNGFLWISFKVSDLWRAFFWPLSWKSFFLHTLRTASGLTFFM